MPEPSSRRPSRARPGSLAVRVAALCAAGGLALSTALPASALGEDGPFSFPAETTTLEMVPSSVTRTPLVALIEDDVEAELDISSARLGLPEEIDAPLRAQMALGRTPAASLSQGRGAGPCSARIWCSPRNPERRARPHRSR
ncbi:hypothetical protein [Brachybacterium sp. Z12]|uniref:hypothetical protein n=1 Tax=Brachybacterium sp. Z12 TaxID=2759167 RepID=UPI00223B21A8|nr:hypothetical protein [Brachybacterium sp. Z12]